ncbi:SRPBCC family protein [Catenovulum agarivorans]|uniref:SRPBCC family protein n=1 Tax=Catenovulum agarivorans TaxID=1172192 RepID=UPI0003198604|nr:SRPBCC family protein [Catenovulum agarivorans]
MQVNVSVDIKADKRTVWSVITDFNNAKNVISAITDLQVLEQPKQGLIGFKWSETRKMFGKDATETMWITDVEENHYYQTRAESHGAIYISRLIVEEIADGTKLTMTFNGQAQTLFGKIMSCCMGFLMKGSMEKMIKQDLLDIKKYVECHEDL